MSYIIKYSTQFKKSLKRCQKRGLDMGLFATVAETLAEKGVLPAIYNPHKLSGKYVDCWECHIKPDWILIWQQFDHELILLFLDTGAHADIFKK
ncbi:MAG: type II toxin-antitoxin system YafQ family toxin [Bacteroidales bacterium]|nr:type II toxin-antitoxin system YafQ family toxin [Bacteroidales bacterium]MBR6162188.1 type II toxin-antitoxin system YafQ family toxin [Bacteroidales bacterium]